MAKDNKIKKTKVKATDKDGSICIKCTSLCCMDLTYTITRPRTRADIDELKWDLQYDIVNVYIKNKRWYETFKGKCMYLDGSNLCRIYDKRPKKCRDHLPPACEKFGDYYDVLITTPEELEKHLKKST